MEYHLKVSELFYSLQGEGRYLGVPAFFVRLTSCNLHCGCGPNEGFGTWKCDTYDIWKKGEQMNFEKIFLDLATLAYPFAGPETPIEEMITGFIKSLFLTHHLIVTGGEPLLQQKRLAEFLHYMTEYKGIAKIGEILGPAFVEVETNGTIIPDRALCRQVMQWNVSPKLANSGEESRKFFKPDAIEFFLTLDNVDFKFVISSPEDYKELEKAYLGRFPKMFEKLILMPACETRDEHYRALPIVADIAKREGVRMTPRLQIEAWNMTTGV